MAYGDELPAVATRFGISLGQILQLNPWIPHVNRIEPGWTLDVPCQPPTDPSGGGSGGAVDLSGGLTANPSPNGADGIIWGQYAFTGARTGERSCCMQPAFGRGPAECVWRAQQCLDRTGGRGEASGTEA